MMHWDEIDLLDGSNTVLTAAVPATVYTKSQGEVTTGTGTDGISLVTRLKVTLDPDVAITATNRVRWNGDVYSVLGVVPVAAKGIVKHLSVELSRAVG